MAFLVFGLSFGIRMWLLWFGGITRVYGDEGSYLYLARKFQNGTFFQSRFMPGWPYLLSLLKEITSDRYVLRILIVVISAASSVLVYLIAKRVAGEKCGIVAAVIHVINPEQAFFSHYFYAEPGLELIILTGTWIAFRGFNLERRVNFLLASGVFGLGLLYKHFAIIPLVALIVLALVRKEKILTVMLMALIAAGPLVLFSVWHAHRGGKLTYALYSPIMNMMQWHQNRMGPGPEGRNKLDVVRGHFKKMTQRSVGYTLTRIQRNFMEMWGSDSYPIWHVQKNFYKERLPKALTIIYILFFHYFLMVVGFTGLVFEKPSAFRTYAMATIIFFSVLSCFVFVMSRYREPFMWIFVIFSAMVLTKWRDKLQMARIHPKLTLAWASGVTVIIGILSLTALQQFTARF